MPSKKNNSVQDQVESLLGWYSQNKRLLPWRKDKDPYHVSVSETMLQQTRIATVIPRYEAFLKAFPSWEDLARADLDRVLKTWEGLGYYSRAKNLHASAKTISTQFGVKFPQKAEEIAKLPGFGEYISAAVASICFGEKAVALDGNLSRVYARLEAVALSPSDTNLRKGAKAFFASFMDYGYPGDINEALMEVGERICLPSGKPLCEACPLSRHCKAYRKGNPIGYPLPKEKAKRDVIKLTVLLLAYQGKYVLEKRSGGLLSSLYGYPTLEGHKSQEEVGRLYQGRISPLGKGRFLFTHKEWDMVGYRVDLDELVEGKTFYSKDEIEKELSLPTAFAFITKSL